MRDAPSGKSFIYAVVIGKNRDRSNVRCGTSLGDLTLTDKPPPVVTGVDVAGDGAVDGAVEAGDPVTSGWRALQRRSLSCSIR